MWSSYVLTVNTWAWMSWLDGQIRTVGTILDLDIKKVLQADGWNVYFSMTIVCSYCHTCLARLSFKLSCRRITTRVHLEELANLTWNKHLHHAPKAKSHPVEIWIVLDYNQNVAVLKTGLRIAHNTSRIDSNACYPLWHLVWMYSYDDGDDDDDDGVWRRAGVADVAC